MPAFVNLVMAITKDFGKGNWPTSRLPCPIRSRKGRLFRTIVARYWPKTYGRALTTRHAIPRNNTHPYHSVSARKVPQGLIALCLRSQPRSVCERKRGRSSLRARRRSSSAPVASVERRHSPGATDRRSASGSRTGPVGPALGMIEQPQSSIEALPAARRELVPVVSHRPGHDPRYAIDPSKIEVQLRGPPRESLHSGLRCWDWLFVEDGARALMLTITKIRGLLFIGSCIMVPIRPIRKPCA